MNMEDGQREMRGAFLGGFAGQLVSGGIWLAAAATGRWAEPRDGMAVLFFGSMLIFPLTRLGVRLLGRSGQVSPANGLWALGSQIAFTVPLNFLLVGAATLYRESWFFPAALVVVGSHYLPFITLYGMRMFALLAAGMVLSGAGLALYGPDSFTLGGWIGAGLLIVFAFVGRYLVLREETRAAGDRARTMARTS